MTTSQALRRRVVFLLLGCEAFVCLPSLRRLLFVPSRDRLLGLLPSSLLVPVPQALRQARVLLEAPRPLHELLVRRLLLERPLAQQLQHVRLVQDLPLQETLPHLRETSELNTGTNQELFNLRLFFGEYYKISCKTVSPEFFSQENVTPDGKKRFTHFFHLFYIRKNVLSWIFLNSFFTANEQQKKCWVFFYFFHSFTRGKKNIFSWILKIWVLHKKRNKNEHYKNMLYYY